VKRAVDGNNITLRQHLLQILDSSASNLLLNLRRQRLVIKVQKLLAVERLQSSENTLTNTANSDGTDNLALEIKLVLGGGSNIPFTSLDLLVCRDEVSDKDEDGHDDVLGDGDDVGSGNLCDCDTSIGLVGRIEINVIGSNTSCNGNLQVLCLCESLGGEVTWMESGLLACLH
jgi:hypothetical protein